MVRIPRNPEEIFERFVDDYRETYGQDLVSIILYGSGARGEYVPNKSDINFLVIISELGMSNLSKAIPLVASWHRYRVSTPLFLTEASVVSSLDTFPIEFLNIRTCYRLVHGKDILRDILFDKKYVRLQCERELKGKLVQLRERFLGSEGRKARVQALINSSLLTFLSLFQAILFLLDREPTTDKHELVTRVARETGLNKELFRELLSIKEGRQRVRPQGAVSLMERYIEEIRKLSGFVDRLTVE